MKNLVNKYFHIPDNLMEHMKEHVSSLSGNRRAVQHFLVELRNLVKDKRECDSLSLQELLNVRRKAFTLWTDPISSALKKAEISAIPTVALICFPEIYCGQYYNDCIIFPKEKFPVEVMKFGLAGGLNLSVSADTVSVSMPRGCVWEFICSNSYYSDLKNEREWQAFVCAAKSVESLKVHAFERLFACELSIMSNGTSKVYDHFQSCWKGEGSLFPDRLAFGQPFKYESRIQDATWKPQIIYCVSDAAVANYLTIRHSVAKNGGRKFCFCRIRNAVHNMRLPSGILNSTFVLEWLTKS